MILRLASDWNFNYSFDEEDVDEDVSYEYPVEEKVMSSEIKLRRELNAHIGTYQDTVELHKLGHQRDHLIKHCTWKSTDCREG